MPDGYEMSPPFSSPILCYGDERVAPSAYRPWSELYLFCKTGLADSAPTGPCSTIGGTKSKIQYSCRSRDV